MCECHVDDGGGDVLPTELNHLTRREVAELTPGMSGKGAPGYAYPRSGRGIWHQKWECEVVSNYNVLLYQKFVVRLPKGETLEFESGGYVQIDVPVVEVDFKDFDITAHPAHDGQSRMNIRKSGTSLRCGTSR